MVVRRLAAVFALDVVGYSSRMATDELATLDLLNDLKTKTLIPAFERWRGRVFKEMGDGMLVEFASVVDAVECGNEIQTAVRERKAGAPDSALSLRIGIHFGEIIVEDDDLFGDTVNIAARIEAIAEPGSVWLSGQAHELLGNRVNLVFEPVGPRKLKNIPTPIRLFGLSTGLEGKARTASAEGGVAAAKLARPSLRLALAGGLCALAAIAAAAFFFLSSDKATSVESAKSLPEDRAHTQEFADCEGCPKMIAIAGGHLLMGAPADGIKAGTYTSDQGPQRLVSIAPFAVGKFEITRRQFAAFLADTDHQPPTKCRTWEDGSSAVRDDRSQDQPGYEQGEDHPAVCLNWHDAQAYVDWLARKTGKSYRLLSEAEWEFVARAGSDTRFFYGNDQNDLCRFDNIGDATARSRWPNWETADCSDGRVFTAPAGSYPANPFGVFDVYGNVREWVGDCWHNTFDSAPADAKPWVTGTCKERVVRGGSWDSKPSLVSSSGRGKLPADHRDFLYGFRIARDLGP